MLFPESRSLTVPVCHEVEGDAGLIVVRASGAVTGAQIFDYYAKLAIDRSLRPGLAVLADCRDVTRVPTFPELSVVAMAEPRTALELRPTHAAVVVSATWLFGIVRQFGALAERSGIQVVPFYDEVEARHWLAVVETVASSQAQTQART